MLCRYFFLKQKDAIRFLGVTGVKTCPLPTCPYGDRDHEPRPARKRAPDPRGKQDGACPKAAREQREGHADGVQVRVKVGRASCRERVELLVGAVSLKKKK